MFPFFASNWLFFALMLPPLLFALWAQWRVQRAFGENSKKRLGSGVTGAEAARRILDRSGLRNVRVEMTQGFLSDHYDPRSKTLRLSPDVFNGANVSAVGVAAHEAGHAVQDQQNYMPLRWRTTIVPAVQIGSFLGPLIFIAGLFAMPLIGTSLAWIGVALFGATAVFALVTLPVEFDASARAGQLLTANGIVTSIEANGVSQVLNAAALTYVAAAVQGVSTLLYYVLMLTGMSSSEE
jgi:Zn-dependent membrane protease YugP